MDWVTGSLAVLVAYLLGGIPFSYLIVKRRSGVDVRTRGSGNPGATNALRVAGKAAGVATLLLDVAKGAVAVLVAQWLGASPAVVAAAAVAAVVGHLAPVYLRFRGGKGVAAATGAMLALAPLALLFSLSGFLITVLATRFVALGSIVGAVLFGPMAYLCGRWGWAPPPSASFLTAAGVIALLIVVRHRSNLRRLREGTEVRIGENGPERDP